MSSPARKQKNRAGLCLVFDQVVFCKVGRSVFDVLYNLFQVLEIAFRIERVRGGLGGVRFGSLVEVDMGSTPFLSIG